MKPQRNLNTLRYGQKLASESGTVLELHMADGTVHRSLAYDPDPHSPEHHVIQKIDRATRIRFADVIDSKPVQATPREMGQTIEFPTYPEPQPHSAMQARCVDCQQHYTEPIPAQPGADWSRCPNCR